MPAINPMYGNSAAGARHGFWPMGTPRRSVLLLLATVVARAAGEVTCECLTSLSAFGIDTSSGLSVSTSQGAHVYPAIYGLSGCAAHDRDLSPFCDGIQPPAWCFQTWCYVNATNPGCAVVTTSTSAYLSSHARGDEVGFSYDLCGASDSFTAWNAAFAGTIKLCSVFATKSGTTNTPCGITATHLQTEAMIDTINGLVGGLGFHVQANQPSFPSFYRFSYEYYTYPNGQWAAVGRNLSETYFPRCDVIVGQGHGCSDLEIREQALVAHAHQKLYFTLRGPRAVLAADSTLSVRLSPYLFSTHIRSDFYTHVSLQRVQQRHAELHRQAGGANADLPPLRLAVLNFAHNAFFEGVGTEALAFAARSGSGYVVVYNASFANGGVCLPYSATSVPADGSCSPLRAYVDALLAARPDVLVISSLAEGYGEVLTRLSAARHSRAADAPVASAASHVLKSLFWVGVPWLSGGEANCKGFSTHCSYALGATQISDFEADNFEDELLRENDVPATYGWLKANNAALAAAYGTVILKAEADAAVIPSILAQALADTFRQRAPANKAQPLANATDYERLRAHLASGNLIARTYYGDVSFDAFGNNKGRSATTFQVDATGRARIIYPDSLPEARTTVYPSPAYSDAPLGDRAYAISFGEACNSTGFLYVGNTCGIPNCDGSTLPCGTTDEVSGAVADTARCLLCPPLVYAEQAPQRLPWGLVVTIIVSVVAVSVAIVAYVVRRAVLQARALEREQLLRVAEAVESITKLNHTAALVSATDFMAMGELISYEALRDGHRLQYFDSRLSLATIAASGKSVVFLSHQVGPTLHARALLNMPSYLHALLPSVHTSPLTPSHHTRPCTPSLHPSPFDTPRLPCYGQWTSWNHPDPTRTQYKAMVAAVRHVAEQMGWPLENVLVWADYCSIPQSNESEQLEAIKSLPGYVSCATAFVIVAPTVRHSNKAEDCDLQSYRHRMWCRVEQLCFLMSSSADAMFVATGEDASSIVPVSHDTDWLRENLYVFEGDATDDHDKIKLVTPLLGLYATMLMREKETLMGGTGEAGLNETQRLFRGVLNDKTRPLFPRTVTVEFVLTDGERMRVPNPKPQILFGNLPQRTSQLVHMTPSANQPHETLAARPSTRHDRAKQSYAERVYKAARMGGSGNAKLAGNKEKHVPPATQASTMKPIQV